MDPQLESLLDSACTLFGFSRESDTETVIDSICTTLRYDRDSIRVVRKHVGSAERTDIFICLDSLGRAEISFSVKDDLVVAFAGHLCDFQRFSIDLISRVESRNMIDTGKIEFFNRTKKFSKLFIETLEKYLKTFVERREKLLDRCERLSPSSAKTLKRYSYGGLDARRSTRF